MAKKAKTKAPKVKRLAKAKHPAKAKRSTAARGEMRIVAVAGAKLKEPGSKGRAHYDKMIGKKVADYLSGYGAGEPRKTAGQWLGNFIRENLVRLR
jgi:hypothetical protein